MLGSNKYMLIGVGVAALALLVIVKKKGAAAAVGAAVGGAAVDAVGGAASGVSFGLGDLLGVPRTNMTECEKALAEGRMWDASFSCPASRFTNVLVTETINPASPNNIINRGVEGIGKTVTGNDSWTLGGQIYDWWH